MTEVVKGKVGRPRAIFTDEQRNQVEVLSGVGVTHAQIAVLLGCAENTLRVHMGPELATGDAKATAKIAQTLFNKAVNGDTASVIFWMKRRARWKEVHGVEVAGQDGKAIEHVYRWASSKIEPTDPTESQP